ncbi:MAG: DUF1887 family CARF protein [Bacteroidales bacterium]|nr:DUF1887 family CARF protein [Bacteroidales bacterium]
MSKTIVNIISQESPAPAYIFIREKYVTGDRLLFISSQDSKPALDHMVKYIGVPENQIDTMILRAGDEFVYEHICRRLREVLKKDVHYYVNLAGGTRYLALAVQQAFSAFQTDFFYVNIKDNTIIKTIYDNSIDDDDDYVYPIVRRMKLSEYLSMHGILHDANDRQVHMPIRSESYAKQMLDFFVTGRLNNRDYEILEVLRLDYRNRIHSGQSLRINDIVQGRVSGCRPIPDLVQFLHFLHFVSDKAGLISKEEFDFLTGGWFEEHCYYLAQRLFNPDDILIGVHVARPGVDHDNELDVVFMKDNHIHVVECKSGISSNKLFNEIVYKACALKEALLGLMCHYYLFSLKKDNAQEDFRKIANIMGVDFWSEEKLKKVSAEV